MLLDKHNRCCNGLWFVNDFCGIICAILTWILIIYAQYSVITCLILPQNDIFYRTINFVIFETLLFLASVSHLKTMFSDPGSVPRGTATREAIESLGLDDSKILYKCQKCCAIKPERSHHCSICKRCIRKMDHHCPFVNNCVALNNQKYFVLFTLYIALVSIHVFIITILHLINCIKNDWSNCDSQPMLNLFTKDFFRINDINQASPYALITLIILIFESLLLAIFTIIMFAVQIQGIYYDETGIENLKKQKLKRCSKNMPFLKRFKIVFGNISLSWFNPFTKPMFSDSLDFNNLTHYV